MLGMEWAWLIPALSFIAFPLIIAFGRFLPGKGSWIAIGAIAAGFVLFWFVFLDRVASGATGSDVFRVTWFWVGDVRLTWGMIIDPLSVAMLGLVTFVAFMIQVYSLGYMHGDPRFGLYFAYHALFVASMLTLVLADNFLLLYVAWELVGLCSYLLIGFWYERRSAAEAAKKAFITTRIGDVGFMVGILLLFKAVPEHTFDMKTIFEAVETGAISQGVVTASAILIFLGAMGKSAQFPLHVWLPDAMEGPTPVSALIHAATMVAAGVYLVARAFPIFDAAPVALLVVASIGLITSLMAATMALVMTDIKRIIAYSTITDLGYMMLALGSFGYTAGLFHLLVHGFAKALLFLGAGSVMHGTGGKTDIREMGGLWRVMPFTAITFAIGAFSLGGIPLFAGFFSKDEILSSVLHGRPFIFFLLALVVAALKPLYLGRVLFAVFYGRLKEENRHAHESPPVMAVPMAALAFLSIVFGYLALNWTTGYQGIGSFLFFHEPEAFHFNWGMAVFSSIIALVGFYLTWLLYVRRREVVEGIRSRLATAHRILVNKYYMDDLYQWCIDRIVLVFSDLVALFDRVVVNDAGVNGTADSVRLSGGRLRYHISGKMYNYALGIVIGAVVVAIMWWILAPRV